MSRIAPTARLAPQGVTVEETAPGAGTVSEPAMGMEFHPMTATTAMAA